MICSRLPIYLTLARIFLRRGHVSFLMLFLTLDLTVLGKKLAQQDGGDYVSKENQADMSQLRAKMNKVIKDNKIAMPITRAGIK